EREVAAILERDVREFQRRILEQHAAPIDPAELAAQAKLSVAIHHVPQVPGADEDVFPAIEVDVEKDGRPGPPRAIDARVPRDLGERAIAAVQLQGIALHLRPLGAETGPFWRRGM